MCNPSGRTDEDLLTVGAVGVDSAVAVTRKDMIKGNL
jgi:hypothetical protein